jgi:dipeptidyl aminopeptidase/acylaminoacyl peptidase
MPWPGHAAEDKADLAKLFGAPPQFGEASLSPNGKYLAFVAPVDGVDNVLVSSLDSSGKASRFAITDSQAVGVSWHNDAQLIARLKISSKSPYRPAYYLSTYRYFVLSPGRATSVVGLKTDFPGVYGGTALVDFSPDDQNTIYLSALRVHASLAAGPNTQPYYENSLLRANLVSGGTAIVEPGQQTTARWIMDGAGNIVARIDATEAHEEDVYVPSGKEFRKLATINGKDGHIAGLTEDGKALAVLARGENNRLGLYRLTLTDGKFGDVLFSNPDVDVKGWLTDERSLRVIGVTYDDGKREYSYFAPERQRLQKQIEDVLPGRGANIVSMSSDHSKILVRTSGPQNPSTLQLVDLQTSHIDIIAEAYPQLRGMRLGAVRRYVYKTRDGISLAGLLTLPPQGEPKNLPTLVLPEGGFGYSDGNFDWFAQFFAQRGYAVFQAGARDLKRLGDVASMDELGSWMNATQNDIASGIDELVASGIVDSKRVCIAGADNDGYAALFAPVALPNRYSCAISLSAFSDLKLVIRNMRAASYIAINRFNSSLIRNSKEYSDADLDRFSPVRHADQIRAPILLVAGDRDEMIIQSTIMKDALTAAKKPVEMVTLKSEDGSLSTLESRSALLNAVDKFLVSHMGH